MLPNTQTEGNPQQPTGGAEPPASSPSGQPGQPLPDYVVALQNQVASLQAEIKGQQKGADKRFGQMQGDIKRILELKEQGLNESQIQRELWIDSQMTQPPAQNALVQQAPGTSQQNTGLDVEAIVKSLQFPENDPTLAALRIKYANDPNGLVKAAAEVRIAQATSPNPSPASAFSQTAGGAVPGLTQEQADAKTVQLAELYKNYSINKPQIEIIERELKAAGAIK